MTVTTERPTTTGGGAGSVKGYGNWRKPSSPGIAGIGTVPSAVGLGGIVLLILVQMIGGLLPAAVALVLLLVVLVPMLVKNRSGRNAWQSLGTRVLWLRGRRKKQNVYRSGTLSPLPNGQHLLPGLLARSTLYDAVDSHGQPFAMLHVPSSRHYSVVLRADPEGSSLVDASTVDAWVGHWGHWLAELPREPNLVAASATVETAPDPGNRLAREVDNLLTDEAPDLARAMLTEVAGTYAKGSPDTTGRVSLTFTATRRVTEEKELLPGREARRASREAAREAARTGAGRRSAVLSPAEMAAQIGSRLPGLLAELRSTGAGGGVRAMTTSEVTALVRTAYDPAVGPELDALASRGDEHGLSWTDAGPVGQVEGWASMRHDSGTSITWQMTEAPRGIVGSHVLRPLLEASEDLTRKRVTLTYRPHDPAASARIAHGDVRTAITRSTSRAGEARAGDSLDLNLARQTAAEEAGGAGLTRVAMFVTATVDDPDTLPGTADLIDQAAGRARVRVRRVYGGQSAAFAAALGIGIVLDSHVAIPSAIRSAL